MTKNVREIKQTMHGQQVSGVRI